jgi:hypothetical protein
MPNSCSNLQSFSTCVLLMSRQVEAPTQVPRHQCSMEYGCEVCAIPGLALRDGSDLVSAIAHIAICPLNHPHRSDELTGRLPVVVTIDSSQVLLTSMRVYDSQCYVHVLPRAYNTVTSFLRGPLSEQKGNNVTAIHLHIDQSNHYQEP